MPCPSFSASGGFKVVFEYANRFVAKGYNVNIVFPISLIAGKPTFKIVVDKWLRYFYYLFFRDTKPYHWFNLDRRVKLYFTPSLSQCYIPKSDIYIATAVHSSIYLNQYKTNAKKIYFVQGYETWNCDLKLLHQTYRYDMSKITIAPHLFGYIKKESDDVVQIDNGFDFDYFNLVTPIKEKDKFKIVMNFSSNILKGSSEGIQAMEIVREKYPELSANLFGVEAKPDNLPSWLEYYQSPDQQTHNKIYNQAAIFLGTSHSEGFSLTPPEAMMCGCAVVCTDIGGYTVSCTDRFNALTSPVANPQKMADNIIKLIENDELRWQLAENGYKKIQEYTWDKAVNEFIIQLEK